MYAFYISLCVIDNGDFGNLVGYLYNVGKQNAALRLQFESGSKIEIKTMSR